MKTRINGLKYDTDTATYVGCYILFADEARESFTETLYYKRTGEFFIYRHGGDCTDDVNDSCWAVRPEIIPLSIQAAKVWVTCHCSTYKRIRLFGDESDAEPNKCSLSSKALLHKRELKALPYLNK